MLAMTRRAIVQEGADLVTRTTYIDCSQRPNVPQDSLTLQSYSQLQPRLGLKIPLQVLIESNKALKILRTRLLLRLSWYAQICQRSPHSARIACCQG